MKDKDLELDMMGEISQNDKLANKKVDLFQSTLATLVFPGIVSSIRIVSEGQNLSLSALCMSASCWRTEDIWRRLLETEARGCGEGQLAPSRSFLVCTAAKCIPVFLCGLHLPGAGASLLGRVIRPADDQHLVLVILWGKNQTELAAVTRGHGRGPGRLSSRSKLRLRFNDLFVFVVRSERRPRSLPVSPAP